MDDAPTSSSTSPGGGRVILVVAGVFALIVAGAVALFALRGEEASGPGVPPIPTTEFVSPETTVEIERPTESVGDLHDAYRWDALEIGGGGYVTGLEIHDDGTLFARTDVGGAFVYDRATSRWQQVLLHDTVEDPVESDYQVEAVAIAPSDSSRLYLSAGNSFDDARGRVLVSSDGGATWTAGAQRFAIDGNAEWRTGGERLGVDPSNPDIVWLGTRAEGLFRSVDGGLSFDPIDGVPNGAAWEPGLDRAGITFVEVVADAVTVGVAGDGVFRSTDDGVTWTQLWASTGRPFDAETDASGRLWVAEPDDTRVQRFDPVSGEVRTLQPSGNRTFSTVAADPADPDLVLVTDQGVQDQSIWRTTDGGDSWDGLDVDVDCAVPAWLEVYGQTFLSAASIEFDPTTPGRVWFPEGFGVWRADGVTEGDITFVCDTLGIEELVTNDIEVPISGTPVGAHWDRAFFARPPGGVETAVQGPTPRFNSAWALATSPAAPGRVYGIVGDHRFCCENDGEAYWAGFSDDGGTTWTPFGSFADGTHPYDLRFGNLAVSSSDPDVIVWLPTFNRPLHRSDDGGATWTMVPMPGLEDRFNADGNLEGGSHFAYFLRRHVLTADPVAPDTFYLFHVELGVMASTDGGVTWEQRSGSDLEMAGNGFFNARLEAVPGREGHLLFTTGPLSETLTPLYESTDGGVTWTTVPGTAAVRSLGFGAPLTDGGPPTVYLAGEIDGVRGVYRSADDLGSFELVSEAPGGNYSGIDAITGDPEIPGRVYVGFEGNGIMAGAVDG